MGKIDDPKISKPIIRDPEPAGTPIERKDPPDNDKGEPGKSEIVSADNFERRPGLSLIAAMELMDELGRN